ncbi:MAG: hypothetical protein ACE5HZ_04940 [Fidelibacterota bacterium]
MKWIKVYLFLLAVAVAQEPPYGPGPHGMEMPQRDEGIRMMKMWKLTEVLELTEDQAKVFFPRHSSFTDQVRALSDKQSDLLKEVDAMLDEGKKIQGKDLSRILEEVTVIEKEKLDKKREFFEGLGDILTPEQKARFLVFEGRFKRDLWHHVRRRAGMGSDQHEMKMKMKSKRKRWP